MSKYHVIDTFPQFCEFWNTVQRESLDEQINAWASGYMTCWPELLKKQTDDYSDQGEDWRGIAKEKVFPFLAERLPEMKKANSTLRGLCERVYIKTQEVLGFESEVIFVIYVGIGCGAGWATTYEDKPAILIGLENVAECGWTDSEVLKGLIAHELGHLVHFHWRAEKEMLEGKGPWWQLYTEGFAQRCEHLVLGEESWHMGVAEDWLRWCLENKARLAREFLKSVGDEQSVRRFFGSWYAFEGRSQTGYFLGCELVRQLEKEMSLKEIALLGNWSERMRRELETAAVQ